MFEFGLKKARMVLNIIYRAYQVKTHLYKYVHAQNGNAPQHRHIPASVKKGSLEHQTFLFFANLLTYHSQSDQGFLQVKNLFENRPELFSPHLIFSDLRELQNGLKSVGFLYPNEGGRRWHISGTTLFREHEGSPVTLFKGVKSIDHLLKKHRWGKKNYGFVGLGPKLWSLLAIFYEELEISPNIPGAFPVDIHVQAECIGLGLVKSQKELIETTRLAEFIRGYISRICREEKMSALDLSHAMWFLGNRVCSPICRRNQGQAEYLCPVYAYCEGRISTKLYAARGKWKLNDYRQKNDEPNLF